jgi:hypothetical protein
MLYEREFLAGCVPSFSLLSKELLYEVEILYNSLNEEVVVFAVESILMAHRHNINIQFMIADIRY